MPNLHEGKLDARGKRVAIIASRFNDFVTHRLVDGAVDCFVRNGAEDSALDVYWVPGSFEVPQLAQKLSQSMEFDGILCLGTIIRGDTFHFEVLSGTVFRAISGLSSRSQIPVTHGMITADSPDQAMDRAGGKGGNKGWDGAEALIEMMNLWKS
ncbi:MAG: 6,7-dimethyl-8-ribityllumazine synthase [bacterium]